MYKLRTIVLEDEDDNRNWLVKKLAQFQEIDLVGEAATLDDAFLLIANTQPDAAFMDIQLIGGSVFSLLNRLQENGIGIPHIVITTGYPEYAMNALNDYRRYVVQYLVKPFVEDWPVKLRKSVDALVSNSLSETPHPASRLPKSVFISNRGNLLRLDYDKIAYLEAAGGGETFIVTDSDTHRVDMTLTKFLEFLPPEQFQRISKTNVVNMARISFIHREDRTIAIETGAKQKLLGIGDVFYPQIVKKLPLAKGRKGDE